MSIRIVEINGFKLFVNDDYQPYRQNIVCYSKILENQVKYNNWDANNPEHVMIVTGLLNTKKIKDVTIVKCVGYY